MEAVNVKEDARKIVADLKEDSTWDDLMQKIYIRQAIEAGLADSMAGRTTDVHDIRKSIGLIRRWITYSRFTIISRATRPITPNAW
jgi:hypothetical protein